MRCFWLIVLVLLAACGKEDAPGGGGTRDASSMIADASSDDASGFADAEETLDAIGSDAASLPDAAPADVVSSDVVVDDAGALPSDADLSDVLAADADLSDALFSDALAPDVFVPDVFGADVPAPDALVADSGAPDAGTPSNNVCTSSRDCFNGEVCGDLFVTASSIETRCTAPRASPPAQPVGGSCTQDSQCATNLCLDGVVNECGLVCSDAAIDCPSGFACPSYRYNPGSVWIPICNRACTDDGDCASTAGNVCSPQTYQRSGMWRLDNVCQAPAGAVALGGACTGGNDCRSGLCFTLTRIGIACGQCAANEACQCPDGSGPPCASGAMTNCVASSCTSICDDPSDCTGGTAGHNLTACETVNLGFPDGTTAPVQACGPP